jgi:hypothetical protein
MQATNTPLKTQSSIFRGKTWIPAEYKGQKKPPLLFQQEMRLYNLGLSYLLQMGKERKPVC